MARDGRRRYRRVVGSNALLDALAGAFSGAEHPSGPILFFISTTEKHLNPLYIFLSCSGKKVGLLIKRGCIPFWGADLWQKETISLRSGKGYYAELKHHKL